jgi:photosystem II stability/assembly factor-like uncharacterized protein
MISRLTSASALLTLLLVSSLSLPSRAAAPQQLPADLFGGLKWRNIGPFHGGRIAGITGAIGQPGVFYAATPQGGIWKTTNAGVTWLPVFDSITDVDSVGSVQVAPSDPNIVYAGTGDPTNGNTNGNGMYKSTDAGKSWTHIGLEDTVKIAKLVIDPKDPDIVLAGTQGDATHHGGGVYRTTDGGKTWQNVLKPEGVTGTRDLEYAFDMPSVVFAATQAGGGFGGGGGAAGRGAAPTSFAKLYKSTDAGKTWTEVTTVPHYPGRISVAVAMHTNGQRIYVVGNAIDGGSGVYRSDDQGATWKHVGNGDARVSNGQGAYSSGIWVDSQNPDVVYVVSIALYRSTDGGNTFISYKGAPGGEDYHNLWIDPTNGQRIAVGADQGATVTLDGGKTWSLWYTQPIAQVYHVSTDAHYPYWVMAAQQDTGAVRTRSRGDFGQVNFIDWSPLPASEFGTINGDPLHPEIIYGEGYGAGQGGGTLIKINTATGQFGNVAPNFGTESTKYRQVRDFWERFDTAFEPQAMYVGYQCLLVTRDGAQTWKAVSPDLTTTKDQKAVACGTPPTPPPAGAQPQGGGGGGRGGGPAIADFFISTAQKGALWTVSSNAQFYRTVDAGLHWTNVSNVSDAPANTTFNTLDGGHHDAATAYVSGRITAGGRGGAPENVDTNVPLIWRTHDGGKTWTKIVSGLPSDETSGSWVNVVREDPKQKGLLFAGTETTVYVSFDDGDHWQSLRQNLPSTSIRDLVFHTTDHMNDIVIGTYGRGFWVLDDMSPLRELAAKSQEIAAAPAYLFKPGDAIRARFNGNWDQPTSVEMPHAPNPPYGALIYYHLSQPPTGEMTLQIFDAAGKLVRTISSTPPAPVEGALYPDYWLATPQSRALATAAGTNRINWDLQYDDPPAFNHDLENQMNMVEAVATPGPHGPQVPPGTYTLKLTADGKVYTQSLVVHNDPRVGESPAILNALKSQNALTMLAYQGMKDSYAANEEVAAARAKLAQAASGQGDAAAKAKELDAKLAAFGGAVTGRGGRGGGFGGGGRGGATEPGAMQSFLALNNAFSAIVSAMQVGLDMAPTKAKIATWETDCKSYNTTVTAWKKAVSDDLGAFNVPASKVTTASCTFAPTATTAATASTPARGR